MSRKYPYTSVKIEKEKNVCPKCGIVTYLVKITETQVSWFRGDDEVEKKILCPICDNWKTACKICGKVCQTSHGLEDHTRMKHNE